MSNLADFTSRIDVAAVENGGTLEEIETSDYSPLIMAERPGQPSEKGVLVTAKFFFPEKSTVTAPGAERVDVAEARQPHDFTADAVDDGFLELPKETT